PLSLYLLTFIVAFDHPRWYRPGLMAGFTVVIVYLVAVTGPGRNDLFDCGIPGNLMQSVSDGWASMHHIPKDEYPASPEFRIGFITFAAMNFAALFGICLLCHGELVRLRPDPRYLTSFYLMIAAGGALGGVAVSLLAPQLFVTYFEWNLSMFAGY